MKPAAQAKITTARVARVARVRVTTSNYRPEVWIRGNQKVSWVNSSGNSLAVEAPAMATTRNRVTVNSQVTASKPAMVASLDTANKAMANPATVATRPNSKVTATAALNRATEEASVEVDTEAEADTANLLGGAAAASVQVALLH